MGGAVIRASYAGGEGGARLAARAGAAIVVVDAYRASTTIAVLVQKGARVVPVASVEEAASYPGADHRVGERGSKKVPGFDFGNSPTEILRADNIAPGATVALTTTNGTRVLEAARLSPLILAGAFVNATAVAEALSRQDLPVAVIACGWEGSRSGEDEAAAGAILHRLGQLGAILDTRAENIAARYASLSGEDLRARLRANSAARRLKRLGYEADLDFCLREDAVPVVPRLENNLEGEVSGRAAFVVWRP